MKLRTRILSFVTAAAAAVFAMPLCAFAEEEEQDRLYHGTYLYLPSFTKESTPEEYYYSDAFFASSGKEKNDHLRTASFDLVTTGFCSSDRETKSSNAIDFLRKIGFSTEDIVINDMEEEPQANTLGSVISHKKTSHGEVIAVCTRGARYSKEWIGNFDCGSEGDIHGFTVASDMLIERIKDYEEQYDLKGAKLWLVGFSRSGGVCDLTGRYINTHLDEFGISEDDLYVYTFEAPRVSAEDTNFENIHNVISPIDIVPKFYPAVWGFYDCGVEELLEPEIPMESVKTIDLKSIAKGGSDADTDPVALDKFEDDFIEFVASSTDREEFSVLGEHMGGLIAVMQDVINGGVGMKELRSYIKDTFSTWFMVKTGARVLGMMSEDIGSKAYNKDVKALSNAVVEQLEESDYEGIFTDEQMETITAAVPPLLEFAIPVIINDYNGEITLSYLATLIYCAGDIGDQHMSQILFPQVRALDPYFTEGVEVAPGKATLAGQEFDLSEAPAGLTEHDYYSQQGFTDEDIEYILGGYDVSYDFIMGECKAFDELDETSKAMIEPYLEKEELEEADILMFTPSFERTRGFDEPETVKLDKKRAVTAQFDLEGADAGSLRIVCVNGEKTEELGGEFEAEGESGVTARFEYGGEGSCFLISEAPATVEKSDKKTAAKTEDKSNKVLWLAVIGGTGLVIAAVVIVVAAKRKKG